MIYRDPASGYREYARELGAVFDINSRTPGRTGMKLLNLRAWIVPAIELSQISVFYDGKGRAVGYFTWAYLSEISAERYQNDEILTLNMHQWAEGDAFWILDLVALDGSFSDARRYLIAKVLPEVGAIHYLRRDAAGKVRKVLKVSCTRKKGA